MLSLLFSYGLSRIILIIFVFAGLALAIFCAAGYKGKISFQRIKRTNKTGRRAVVEKEVRRVFWKTSKLGFMGLGGVGLFFVLLAGLFVWRVSAKPLDISFVKGTIEAAIYDRATGSYARMDKAVLFWPSLNGPLYLQIHNGQFFNKDGSLISSAGQIDVSFSGFGLLTGRILPKAIILKEPTVRVEREENGSFSFDIGAEEEPEEEEKPGESGARDAIREMLTQIGSPVRDQGIMSRSLLSQLRGFSIEDARLFVDDKVLHQTWSLPDFDLAFMSTGEGAGGFAHMALPGSSGEDMPALDVAIEYDWWKGYIELSTDVIALDVNEIIGKIPALDIPSTQDIVISSHVEVILNDKNFMPTEVRIDALSDGGHISHPKLSDEPIAYENLALSMLYDYEGKVLQLRDTHLSLGGVMFQFSGNLNREDKKIHGPVRVWTKDVEHARIKEIWPKFLKGKDAEKWVVQRMADGVFEEVAVSFDMVVEKQSANPDESEENLFDPEAGLLEELENLVENPDTDIALDPEYEPPPEPEVWSANVEHVKLDFKARDMTLDYHPPLPKAYHVNGSGQLDLEQDSLTIELEKAEIAGLKVGASKLYFDRLIEVGVGDADMTFAVKSSVADVLRYIANDPINLGQTGMDIDQVKGDADLKVWLHFPARDSALLKDFKIDISGPLSEVLFPGVVRELDITGGPLQLDVKDNQVKVEGPAKLDGNEIELTWETFLKSEGEPYKEKVQAHLQASDELRGKLGIDLTEFLEGTLDTELTYTTFRDGTAEANVKGNLKPAFLFIDPFDYEKPEGEEGEVVLNAFFKNGTLQKVTDLSAKAPEFEMSDGALIFTVLPAAKDGEEGKLVLASGNAPKFTLGETKSSLKFAYDKARTVDIMLDASFLDARPFMDGEDDKEDYDAPPMRITATAKKMRTAPEETASDVRAYFEIDGQGRFDQIEMDAVIGSSGVLVRFDEEGSETGKRTFRMKTDDAGALLKAFGVYKNVVGGTMIIYGEPMNSFYDRNIRGKAEMVNFKVVKAPALAKLLSLMSLGGIKEVLASDGLHFEKMEVEFSWLYRKQGSLLELKDGRSSGSVLGILFEGTFDNSKREVDISGTVAPMDTLNKVLGKIPLLGNILTGGEGRGVFAATYSIKGPSDDPEVSVNPLSVLTPGILRRILWE